MRSGMKLLRPQSKSPRNLAPNAVQLPKETEDACTWYARGQGVDLSGAGCVKLPGAPNVWGLTGLDRFVVSLK